MTDRRVPQVSILRPGIPQFIARPAGDRPPGAPSFASPLAEGGRAQTRKSAAFTVTHPAFFPFPPPPSRARHGGSRSLPIITLRWRTIIREGIGGTIEQRSHPPNRGTPPPTKHSIFACETVTPLPTLAASSASASPLHRNTESQPQICAILPIFLHLTARAWPAAQISSPPSSHPIVQLPTLVTYWKAQRHIAH